MSQGGYQPPPPQRYYQPPPQQGYYQPQPGYPPQDVEANKPPPYTSTYVYGEQPQAPPPPQDYSETDSMLPSDDNPGISSFSEKSVRQGLQCFCLLNNVKTF